MEAHKMIEMIPGILERFFSEENQDRVEDIAENVREASDLVIVIMNDLFKLGISRSRAVKSKHYAQMYSFILKEIDKYEVK